MENIKVRTYITPRCLKNIWPQNKFVYTIECYTSNRIWSDSYFSLTSFLGIKIENYIEAMKVKFDCIESQGKIFYSTKQECEQAIKFIDSIKIMNELSR